MEKYSLSYLQKLLQGKSWSEIDRSLQEYLLNSPYKSARKLVEKLHKKEAQKEKERARIERLYKLEREFWAAGQVVVGLDEAGRGPLAGPVVAGAVVLAPENPYYPDLKDSKKLTEEKRELLYEQLISTVKAWAIGMASNREIDKYNILNATKLAMKRAIRKLKSKIKVDVLLIDAVRLSGLEYSQFSFAKGEDKSASIAAASIIAKVYRDRLMVEKYHTAYPQYNFAHHKGYGTAEHLQRLKYYGPCKIHRLTFKRVLTNDLKDFQPFVIAMMKKMVGAAGREELEKIKLEWETQKSNIDDKEQEFLSLLYKKLSAWWSNGKK